MKLAGLYLVIFIVGFLSFTFIFDTYSIGPARNSLKLEETQLTQPNENREQNTNQASPNNKSAESDNEEKPQQKSKSITCTNLDCFIQLAKSCTMGEIDNVDFPYPFEKRITLIDSTYFKINGPTQDGECELLQVPKQFTISITDEARNELKKENEWSDDELESQIQGIIENQRTAISLGTKTTCTGPGENVAVYITNLSNLENLIFSCESNTSGESYCDYEPRLHCTTESNLHPSI